MSLPACDRGERLFAGAPALTPEMFPDVLDLRGTPATSRDLSAPAFSDLGAWHMVGLPGDRPGGPGGFTGPLLLFDDATWLGTRFLAFEYLRPDATSPNQWEPDPGTPGLVSLPGSLRQELVDGDLALRLDLVFASDRSALVRAVLTNRGSERIAGRPAWSGVVDLSASALTHGPGGLVIRRSESETVIELAWSDRTDPAPRRDAGYRVTEEIVELAPGESIERHALVSVYADENEHASDSIRRDELLSDPRSVFRDNTARWSGYVGRALRGTGALPPTDPRARLAVKAVQTLVSNWRSPAGHLYHDGLFPSYAYRGFHGIWSWDSWKHARALALFAPELAKDQIRVMLDHQNERGMIPDVIYRDSTENNWRDTKPPLLAWAVHGIFEATGDRDFVEEVRGPLERYHAWWYQDRDHDGDGLCEYGSTDGTRIAAAWESGMDNAVRFDSATMVHNGPGAWSLDQESVDLNAYLYADKLYLAELAEAVGQPADAETHRTAAGVLAEKIRTLMFDPETGYFHDIRLDDDEPVAVAGPEGWIPLWAGIATDEQARSVASVMGDAARFNGVVPLPTLDMTRPEFDPTDGYWRGPVWLDQAYFGVEGLRRYGFVEQADETTRGLLEGPRWLLGQAPIHENYDPRNGAGLNAAHFSWSAAHYLMLLQRPVP